MTTEDQFHLGVKGLIRNALGQILLLQVNNKALQNNVHGEYWDLPGGRIHTGSSAEETLRREIREETGIVDIKKISPLGMVLSNVRIPIGSGTVGLVLSVYECSVSMPVTIAISDEHISFRWFTPTEAADLLRVKYPIELTDKIKNLVTKTKQPFVGFGVIVKNEKGEVLLCLRHGSHGAGEWGFPGGKLEFGETLAQSVRREMKEETGLTVGKLELISVGDEMRYIATDGKHFFNVGLKAEYLGGEPELREPDKHVQWKWFAPDALPENVLEGTAIVWKNYLNKTIYHE